MIKRRWFSNGRIAIKEKKEKKFISVEKKVEGSRSFRTGSLVGPS